MKRVLLIGFLAVSCGGRGQSATPASDSTPPPNASPSPPISTAPGQPAQQLGHLMVGAWEINPAGVAGPSLSVEIVSARGGTFRGTLTRALAGDVLLDVGRFQPFTGTIAADSTFAFRIEWWDKGPPPTDVGGKINRDGMRLTRFVWGGEQQVVAGRTWTGRKVR